MVLIWNVIKKTYISPTTIVFLYYVLTTFYHPVNCDSPCSKDSDCSGKYTICNTTDSTCVDCLPGVTRTTCKEVRRQHKNYILGRSAKIVTSVGVVLLVLSILACCCFCPKCPVYIWREKRKHNAKVAKLAIQRRLTKTPDNSTNSQATNRNDIPVDLTEIYVDGEMDIQPTKTVS